MKKQNKFTQAISLGICITLLIQILWTDIALAYDLQPYNQNPQMYDAVRNGVSLAFNDVTVGLPTSNYTVTNVFNFQGWPGVSTLLGKTVAQRIDSTKLDPLSKPYMVLWRDRYTEQYFSYDFDGLVANPRDTMWFSHVIVDTSQLDSAVMQGATTRAESLMNRVKLRVANKVENTITGPGADSLVWLYRDNDRSRGISAGDTPMDSAAWTLLAPGESLYVLIKAAMPIVSADSSMDTISLICQSDRSGSPYRPLTKIYKDVVAIELIQAQDAMAWIEPETVIAGSRPAFTYNVQLILGTADEFRLVNPFADPARYSAADTNDYDTMTVTGITFGATVFNLSQSAVRPALRNDAAWHYDRATDTLYVRFNDSRLDYNDTVRITFQQSIPTVVPYDSVALRYTSAGYAGVFDDHIDPTVPDLMDTILGVPQVWIIPDSARIFGIVVDSDNPTIRNDIHAQVTARDRFGNRILTYAHPAGPITLTAMNPNTNRASTQVRYTIGGLATNRVADTTTFNSGLYTDIAAVSDSAETVLIGFVDSVNNVFGWSDTIYWVDRIVPLIAYTATADTNGNGIIDRILVRFDSPVDSIRDYGFTIRNYTKDGSVVVGDTLLIINVVERSGRYNTADRPFVEYDDTRGRIRDKSQFPNRMLSAGLAALDQAPAVVCSAFYYDSSTVGLDDDLLRVYFSERMKDSTIGGLAVNEFNLYNGSLAEVTIQQESNNDSLADLYFLAGAETLNVGRDSLTIIAGAINDLAGNPARANNQKVLVVDRTAPVVTWLAPLDSIRAYDLTHLTVQCNVVEWQGIGRNNVTLEWYVPVFPGDPANKAANSTQLQLSLNNTTRGDSLRFSSVINMYDVELAGGDEVVFNIVATDNAGNRTRIDSIAVLPITASSRWYHCSRGKNDGYDGKGIPHGVDAFDAWCYVPRNTIIFDSVSIRHFYNGEVGTPAADAIAQANIHAQANQNIGVLDERSAVKVHEFSIVTKDKVQKRYDDSKSVDHQVQLELYYDDLSLSDQQQNKLTLFKLDDYQVVQRLDGTLDTIIGSGEWVPVDTMSVAVLKREGKIVLDVDLSYVPDGQEDNGLRYGLGIYTMMTYVEPTKLVSSLINYPSPFNPMVSPIKITYVLKENANVKVSVFNLIGDLVWSKSCKAGMPGGTGSTTGQLNEVAWDGYSEVGRMVSNGGYLVKITAESNGSKVTIKKKLSVLK